SRNGGNLGTDGSVAYLFKKLGQITFAPGVNEEKVLEVALDAGAEDVVVYEDKSIEVVTLPDAMPIVKEALAKAGFQAAEADVTMLPSIYVAVADKEIAEEVMSLTDALEDLD